MRQKSISYTITVSWGKKPEKQNASNGSRSNCGRANRTKGYDRVQYSCSTIVGEQCWLRRKLEKELCISNIVRYQESWRKLTYPVCYKYQMSEGDLLLIECQGLYQDLFGQIQEKPGGKNSLLFVHLLELILDLFCMLGATLSTSTNLRKS